MHNPDQSSYAAAISQSGSHRSSGGGSRTLNQPLSTTCVMMADLIPENKRRKKTKTRMTLRRVLESSQHGFQLLAGLLQGLSTKISNNPDTMLPCWNQDRKLGKTETLSFTVKVQINESNQIIISWFLPVINDHVISADLSLNLTAPICKQHVYCSTVEPPYLTESHSTSQK